MVCRRGGAGRSRGIKTRNKERRRPAVAEHTHHPFQHSGPFYTERGEHTQCALTVITDHSSDSLGHIFERMSLVVVPNCRICMSCACCQSERQTNQSRERGECLLGCSSSPHSRPHLPACCASEVRSLVCGSLRLFLYTEIMNATPRIDTSPVIERQPWSQSSERTSHNSLDSRLDRLDSKACAVLKCKCGESAERERESERICHVVFLTPSADCQNHPQMKRNLH